MRQPLRFFAVGLLVASILLYGYFFFFVSSKVNETEMETDELITQIEEKGYRVISEEDYLSYTFLKQQEEDKEKDQDDKEANKKDKDDKDKTPDKENKDEEELEKEDETETNEDENDDNEEVKEYTFTTGDNVVSQSVADELLDNGIIDDRQEFLNYLDDNDYSSYIQIGTFTVSSDMSLKELAEVITTYPGN